MSKDVQMLDFSERSFLNRTDVDAIFIERFMLIQKHKKKPLTPIGSTF